MIFDHIVLYVKDLSKSRKFYEAVLPQLGIDYIKVEDACIGFGSNGKASFWICNDGILQNPMHIAFQAPDRHSIELFYEAGLMAGGFDNGKPGLREKYQPYYYSAFLLDPDGHNIEAVYRKYMVT